MSEQITLALSYFKIANLFITFLLISRYVHDIRKVYCLCTSKLKVSEKGLHFIKMCSM